MFRELLPGHGQDIVDRWNNGAHMAPADDARFPTPPDGTIAGTNRA
jgi:hypothetical protein